MLGSPESSGYPALPIFSVVAPCQPGASPPSMPRRLYEMSSNLRLYENIRIDNYEDRRRYWPHGRVPQKTN